MNFIMVFPYDGAMTFSGYDIIGDIHGYASKLWSLLDKMGYQKKDGVYTPPEGRQAIFVGDFIDRGPQQAAVLNTVRPMVESGHARAIMANHEFNAVCFATRHPEGDHIRKHTDDNRHQHGAFLQEFSFGSDAHRKQIAWFKTLPVFLDLKDIFVIHACYHPESIEVIRPYLKNDNTLTDQAYVDFAQKGTPFYHAIEIALKGAEHHLPEGVSFKDPNGIVRRKSRVFWWRDENLPTSRRLECRHDQLTDGQAQKLDASFIVPQFTRPSMPVFFGHYWLSGRPEIFGNGKLACVDYSAGNGGPLVAYRWSGEKELTPDHFVWANIP